MNPLGVAVVVLVLAAGMWARVLPSALPTVIRPGCDTPEAEEAALVARDYLNALHKHGYKFTLNRIEDIKILPRPGGDDLYFLEVDLLETDCHVLDPKPIANCTVRDKVFTAVEADCDVVLKKVAGALTVSAFKCKTEESREDICSGCPILLPLNDTVALDFVSASLTSFNNITEKTFALLEVGRMSSQVLPGGPFYAAEYVIVEANCTGGECLPLSDPMAQRGFCSAKGLIADHVVTCNMFATMIPQLDANATASALPDPPKAVHFHAGHLSHHKLTTLHDPELSGLLSSESVESSEAVPVAPAVVSAPTDPAGVVKRQAPEAAALLPAMLVPMCPGKIIYF